MVKKDIEYKKTIKELTKAVKELTSALKKSKIIQNNDEAKQSLENKRVKIDHSDSIKSPMVGTVYLSPEPGSKTFIKQNQMVKKGDTLLIIEAMKTFNPIISPKAGRVVKILVNDSEPIEFGQPLIVIK